MHPSSLACGLSARVPQLIGVLGGPLRHDRFPGCARLPVQVAGRHPGERAQQFRWADLIAGVTLLAGRQRTQREVLDALAAKAAG
jgi:hypothetical protein